jgi:hypothetical protein
VTLLEITDGIIEIRSTAGDTALGGDDFTSALAGVLKARVSEAGREAPKARVLEAAERAKRALSRDEETQVVLTDAAGGAVFSGPLTREAAQEAWAPLVARMTTPVERALRDAGWTVRDLSRVLLVGGATRMPLVLCGAVGFEVEPPFRLMAQRPQLLGLPGGVELRGGRAPDARRLPRGLGGGAAGGSRRPDRSLAQVHLLLTPPGAAGRGSATRRVGGARRWPRRSPRPATPPGAPARWR